MRLAALSLLLVCSSGLGPPNQEINASSYRARTYVPQPAQSSISSNLALLQKWLDRGPVTDSEEIASAERALAELDLAWDAAGKRRVEIQETLLDFLGRSIRLEGLWARDGRRPAGGLFGAHDETDLRRRSAAILRRRLEELRKWMIHDVLLRGDSQPLYRRIAACEVLAIDESPGVTLALFSSTRSAPAELIDAAISALAGREDPAVHTRLIDLLAQADAGEVDLWRSAIEKHFQSVTLDPEEPELNEKVAEYVASALSSSDWRRASRGISIARSLPHNSAFPILIAGLEHWIALAEDPEQPVRRVQGELESELERRSGRNLGLRPERWTALYEGYLRGDVSLEQAGAAGGNITRAGFFGLRPVTDRVTFVLDRSGSMEANFGAERGHSRLEEATDQMAAFLELLGERTQFNVVVFSDRSSRWKRKLRPATQANIKSARAWVRQVGPDGGTNLATGVRMAMHVDRGGNLDLEALEADTVIVLCDGATAEGPGWVEPLLRRVNDRARLVFHAVQIGTSGDGTLEKLSLATGGEFVRVDG